MAGLGAYGHAGLGLGYAGLGLGGLGYAGLGPYGYSAYPHGLTAAVKAVEHIPAKVEVKALAPVVAAAPLVAAAPALAAAPLGVPAATYLHGAGVPYLAGALGHPLVNTAGVAHVIGKRDAEAEADPAYFYNGYGGYAGFGYAGYGLPHAYGAYRHGAYAGGLYGAGLYGAGLYGGGLYGAHLGLGLAPSDPTNPQLVHTSRLGVCVNYLGAQVPC